MQHTQRVPLPLESSKLRIPHSFALGLSGNSSRRNTPLKLFMFNFLAVFCRIIFDKGMFGNTIPQTSISLMDSQNKLILYLTNTYSLLPQRVMSVSQCVNAIL